MQDMPPRDPDRPDRPDPGRRRFTRGLAAPVLLGTLASQPVLGQSLYHCTPSGQWSGNISHRSTFECGSLGMSPEEWLATDDWSPYDKGDLPARTAGNSRKFTGQNTPGTSFNSVFGGNYYFAAADGSGGSKSCKIVTTAGTGSDDHLATLREVLEWSPDELGREAVVALLNASNPGDQGFPITPQRVIHMFKDVVATGAYYPMSSSMHGWNRDTVIAYWKSLYDAP